MALGLYYLHNQSPPIVNRSLSASNVLLTYNMDAKISDLGVYSEDAEPYTTARQLIDADTRHSCIHYATRSDGGKSNVCTLVLMSFIWHHDVAHLQWAVARTRVFPESNGSE